MQSGSKLIKQMIDTLLPNCAAPVLAKVMKAHEGSGKTKYSVDVRVLKAGTLEETDQVIQEVPISPIWGSQKKRGVYAIPPVDQVVIVEFLQWNPAYPFVAGIWSDEYETDTFSKDQFVITDGDGMKFIIDAAEKKITVDNGKKAIITWEENKITVDNGLSQVILNGDKVAVKNAAQSLFTVLDTLITNLTTLATNVSKHRTVGSPALHVVHPEDIQGFGTDIANLGKDKAALALILEA